MFYFRFKMLLLIKPVFYRVPDCDQVKLDLVLALDGSGSVTVPNFELIREFAKNVVRLSNTEHVRIGILQFSRDVYPEFYLNDFVETVDGKQVQNKDQMLAKLDEMPYQLGITRTDMAIDTARLEYFVESLGARPGVPKRLLVVTDGKSTIPEDTLTAAANAKGSGIHIFAVGINMTLPEQREELRNIASDPADLNVLQVQKFTELDEIYRKIFVFFCRGMKSRK